MHLRKCQNRSMWARKIAVFLLAVLVRAQQRPPLHAQSASTIDFSSAADGSETVEIRNISHEVTGTQVPGRPPGERLLHSPGEARRKQPSAWAQPSRWRPGAWAKIRGRSRCTP